MCQFNLILTKNINNKNILKNNEFHTFIKIFDNYTSFAKGHCNCNSFVGSMSEYNGNSYLEMIEDLNKSELEKLKQIKDFMNKPDYKKLREQYIAEREIYYENNFDESNLNEFVEKNQLMEDSTLYYLTKEDEDNDNIVENISDDNLFEDSDIPIEYIDIPEESFVIDTVIQNLENRYQNDYNAFLDYKQLFESLLENEDYILFCCIWDEPGKLSVEKEIKFNDIKIEDLACLEFNKILKICK